MRKLLHHEIRRPDPQTLSTLQKHPIRVLVDNVRSLHNVGSIFRTSDAARIEHLYLAGITPTPDHRGLFKTSLGAEETVPWSHAPDPLEVFRTVRAMGYRVAVLEITDEPARTDEVPLEVFPLCLVVGNEVDGVSDAVVAAADRALELPQFGAKHSLNVSVAYGIAIFDLVRRYRALTGHPPSAAGNP